MRTVLRLLACVVVVAAAACDQMDRRYFREGIGAELPSPELPEATRIQEIYVGHICQQAGLAVGVTPDGIPTCDYPAFKASSWMLFVQAGMNDIDNRCDAYLQWLDARRRFSTAAMQQISDTRTVTETILGQTGVGTQAITIVGAAFGFAAQTFTNLNTRLLLEVNHSTVQSVVLNRQREYREGIKSYRIDSRPMALHALRSYLRLCMPMTIETEINVTVTAYERGTSAPHRLITPKTIQSAIISDPNRPLPETPTIDPAAAEEIRNARINQALCLPSGADQTQRDAAIKGLLQGARNPNAKNVKAFVSRAISEVLDCSEQGYLTAYEVGRFGLLRPARRAALIGEMRTRLEKLKTLEPHKDNIKSGVPKENDLRKMRPVIREARVSLKLPVGNDGEIDQALVDRLAELAKSDGRQKDKGKENQKEK